MLLQIRQYIDSAFSDVPETYKINELKEELYANLLDKYNEKVSKGKTEQEAYDIAIASIGDIDELVESAREPYGVSLIAQKWQKRSAVIVSISIMLYITCIIPVLIFMNSGMHSKWGLIIMFLMIAAATGMLIYNGMTRPRYSRANDTIVEEFKEWRVSSASAKSVYRSFSGAYWGLVVVIYILFSVVLGYWDVSWIIFILAAAVQNIFKGIIELKNDK